MNTKTPAPATARFLTGNLQYEILSWLPSKSLLRYRSVSKSWYSTIHDPLFIKKHAENQSRKDDNRAILVIPETRAPTICRFFSGRTCEIRFTLDLPFTPIKFDYPVVVGSCNGLICLSDDYNGRPRLHIWNPSIRKHKLLPPYTNHRTPPDNVSTFGFGFHSQSNDYRVVRLTYFYHNALHPTNVIRTEVEVYSLGADSWRMVELDDRVRETRSKVSVSVNEYIYWLAKGGRILSVNTVNDSLEEIMHPSGSGLYLKTYHIAAVRGRLCLMIAPYEFGSSISSTGDEELEIWMMTEHGVYESWTKLWNIRQGERFSGTYGMTVKGELLQFRGYDKKVGIYDHENLRYYDLCEGNFALAVSYRESLVLLEDERGSRIEKKRK